MKIYKVILNQFSLYETRNYYLIDEQQSNDNNIFEIENLLFLKDEFSFKNSVYRNNILSSLIKSYVYNYRNYEADNLSINLYEIGNIFAEDYQQIHLGILLDNLYSSKLEPTVILKQMLVELVGEVLELDINDLTYKEISESQQQRGIFNHYNAIEVYYKEYCIALIGEIHPKILRENKLIRLDKVKRNLFYLEIRFSSLLEDANK